MKKFKPVTIIGEKGRHWYSYDNLEPVTKKQLEQESNYERMCIGDTTKYGEFVSSYFAWITLDKQKEKAEEMQQMGSMEGRNIIGNEINSEENEKINIKKNKKEDKNNRLQF